MKIGILHPGKMGSSIGIACQRNDHEVYVALDGRSDETRQRAKEFGFIDLGSMNSLFSTVDIVFSISMGAGVFPHAEAAIASGYRGFYVDANHIGDEAQEKLLGQMLQNARIRYVEASIYGWPYPHDENPNAERTMYLSGKYSPYIQQIVNGDIFRCLISETQMTAKEIKRMREARDRKNMMPHTDHGCGIVEFHDVIDIDESFITSWLERRRSVEPHDYTIDENGFYVNRGGYKFTKDQITSAPERYLNLAPTDGPKEDIDFNSRLEKAMFDCINGYSILYPEAKDCLWWRTDSHVAVYGVGAGMGLHHDNAIGGASANENPLFNVVSGSLILFDKCSGGELQFRFIKNKIKPKSGSAVFYPSSFMGSHAVAKITEGLRISYLEFFGHGSRPGQTKRL
jgi:hypothetical protein